MKRKRNFGFIDSTFRPGDHRMLRRDRSRGRKRRRGRNWRRKRRVKKENVEAK